MNLLVWNQTTQFSIMNYLIKQPCWFYLPHWCSTNSPIFISNENIVIYPFPITRNNSLSESRTLVLVKKKYSFLHNCCSGKSLKKITNIRRNNNNRASHTPLEVSVTNVGRHAAQSWENIYTKSTQLLLSLFL